VATILEFVSAAVGGGTKGFGEAQEVVSRMAISGVALTRDFLFFFFCFFFFYMC